MEGMVMTMFDFGIRSAQFSFVFDAWVISFTDGTTVYTGLIR